MNYDHLTNLFLSEFDRLCAQFETSINARQDLIGDNLDLLDFLKQFGQRSLALHERLQHELILRCHAAHVGNLTPPFLFKVSDLYTLTILNLEAIIKSFLGKLDTATSIRDFSDSSRQVLQDFDILHNSLFIDIDNIVDNIRYAARGT